MNLNNTTSPSAFHGAAIIDEQGREIPITEAMIQRACEHLENHWQYPTVQFKRAQKDG
ncbi:PA1571 family protein [Alcanivorax sp.]|jgi:EAL domain-containing protein (putative c-di-GMP-specific phosphodiesterase class I)|uniref:PA1571 family protein n=1 Tax=Alcanivorax sp. TaxID=1872427 RepID=UPI0032D97841